MEGTASGDGVGRLYGGETASQRRADRYERLIRAAIVTYGEYGYRASKVTDICREAGLTPRYFYEAFENHEALLIATFREVTEFVLSHLTAAASVAGGAPRDHCRALLASYYDLLREDPASARVFLLEMTGISPAIDNAVTEALLKFARLIVGTLGGSEVDATSSPLRLLGVMNGLSSIAREWAIRGYQEPTTEVIEIAIPFCEMLAFTPKPS